MSHLEHELVQAKNQAEYVLSLIDQAQGKLMTARELGLYDIIAGGFISSMMKRKRMREVNDLLDAIDIELETLGKELKDVDIEYIAGFAVDTVSEIFDVWLDNIFTDLSIQEDIKEVQAQLEYLGTQIDTLADQLVSELNNL